MSYYVFARKYRPQKFAEVLAQRHISETLAKAVEHNRVAQAYLFCGVRGTGKTSVARILAKRLNCSNPLGAEPCDQCESCVGIIRGQSLDILEIDAASHTSVDDIRELRESIKYAPVGGKHKVYIIDEVHRLSPSAFDALLKTLEEPPAHAVFIFATTEVHKVPQTILSRCQRYDFKRISQTDLKSALKEIAKKEGLTITEEALTELSKRGDGSLRDALSILDQVASWQQETIDLALLTQALGILPRSEYRHIIELIRRKDSAAVVRRVSEVMRSGVGAPEFVRGFQEELRLMLVLKAAPEVASEYGLTAEEAAELGRLSADYSLNDLLRIQNLLINLEQKIRDGCDPQINIELTLLKILNMESSISVEEILKELGKPDARPASFSLTAPEPKKKLELTSSAPDSATRPITIPQTTQATAPPASSGVRQDNLQDVWKRFLEALKPTHRNVQLKLSLAEPRSIEGNRISVAFDRLGEVHVRYFQDHELLRILEAVMQNVCGQTMRFRFYVDQSLAHRGDNGRKQKKVFSASEREAHPLVAEAMRIFDAEVIARRDLREDK